MPRKCRILEVNKFYAPHIGGIETIVRQRVQYLAAQPDNEVHVLVCQEQGEGDTSRIDGAEVIRCGSLGTWRSCPVSGEFFRRFREQAKWADVVEIHTPFPPADLACLLSGSGCRVVVSWHSDVIRQRLLLPAYKPILRRFLQRADVILTATQGHIDGSAFLLEFREKCRVLPYPLDASVYRQTPKRPILHTASPYSLKVLYVGRLVWYKGVTHLIRAFRQVQGCELFLCGTGPLEDMLRREAEGLPVHFLGRLTGSELRDAYADCDLFVLPSSERAEAFGIVQQEAMASGKPVINTALPTGVPFVSIHGETGLTVRPRAADALAAAISRLADDPALRRRFGENGRRRVQSAYNPARIMQEYEMLLKGVG